ncbi:MAG: Molybdenum cofactor guanylyltransferase [Candidatus Heimdallarchaeota archaeon LC_3]|nr:MAG: Molybdenum cofactor guanylyltransferase [Candidatus Heimdallarchaeota archaeon LC_3]
MSYKFERTLIINTGGESKRLKESLDSNFSKSWIVIDKESIIIHNLINLGQMVNEIIIVTRNDEEFLFFETKLASLKSSLKFSLKKIKLLVDDKNSQISGPLRGLLTAIDHCQTEIIWWIPSDHPFINANLFLELESKLSKSNIVSLYNNEKPDGFHFEPQIFVTTKSTLTNYSLYTFNRITDVYRVIPDITFITPSNIGEQKSLIGINTMDDLNLAHSSTVIQLTGNKQLIQIKRFCSLNDDLKKIRNADDVKLLYNNSQYFLLKRMIELQMIKGKNLSINELAFLDWKYWKNKNRIIALHCGKDYLRMEESNEEDKAEILESMNEFSFNL